MSNQAAVLYAPHDVRLEERSQPKPGLKEVLVEIKAVGVINVYAAPMYTTMSTEGSARILCASRLSLAMSPRE